MSTIPPDFGLLNHYTVFIYPFLHDIEDHNRSSRAQSLEENWDPWWARLGNEIGSALDNTYFFLPYIREVLFPETIVFKDQPAGPRYENWVNEIDQWNRRGLSSFCQRLPPAVMRIAYKQERLEQIKRFEVFEQHDQAVSTGLTAEIDWIDALLFPSGVGFLLLKVTLRNDRAQLNQLVALNYFLRLVHAPNIDWRLPELSFNHQANTFTVRDLMDFLTQGMAGDDQQINDLTGWKQHVAASRQKRLSESEAGQVYGERCHVFSYACVNAKENGSDKLSTGVFGSLKDRLVFEYASSIAIGDSVSNSMWIPSVEHVQRLKANHQFSVWETWTGMALKESVVFLGTGDTSFNREVLPANVENDYLPLYVYSLYQKYRLFIFADQLMRKGAYVAKHLDAVRSLMDQFMEFRTKYWFNEVTRKPLGGELYSKFQQGLESTTLFDLVSLQVKDLKEHYEERRQRRIDVLLNIVTFVFLPLSAAIGIFGMTFFDEGSWRAFLLVTAIILVVSLGIWRWWTKEFGPRAD
ncbi:MAG TPA: hypothetical protein VFS76_01955 [Pyrinomonadaceae bacterium]|nr:hypothetical protein [Pyrinomonadaceae bacterium]